MAKQKALFKASLQRRRTYLKNRTDLETRKKKELLEKETTKYV